MKYLILVFMVALTGCGQVVTLEELELYLSLCKGNGGVEDVVVRSDSFNDYVYCKDGARFLAK